MQVEMTSDLWWKNAVIYCLDVETFLDSNADGVGDIPGLIQRIDYLAGLGVSCLWLMPFQPTPNRDDGYDVIDYYGVDPRLGDLGDFVELIRTARDRGLRVIADLVVNHTSIEHPWFQQARRDRDSPYRDYYVWRDEPSDEVSSLVFPGEQDSNWSYDELAGQWYLHRFYEHQADLNPTTPEVREELQEIAAFWMELGVAGFRVDAVPFFIELEGIDGAPDIAPHELLRELSAFLTRRRGDSVLLGEVNLPPEEARQYFGESGDELGMVLDFTLNQRLFLALARKDAKPLREHLQTRPELPQHCQWAIFVSNHDELTLDQLDDAEREEVFSVFAPEARMRIYERGIRRRLPSMLGADRARLELVYSLLLSLPGTPILYYGEEIGMGENLEIEGRRAVRTPMQWSDEKNGGFSEAPTRDLRRPLPEGDYGPGRVNVAAQRRDEDSFLSWICRVIRRRRECPEVGMGDAKVVDTGRSEVLAHRVDWCDSTFVAVHNFADQELDVRLDLETPDDFVELVGLLSEGNGPSERQSALELTLPAFGYRWFRVRRRGRRLPL
jgi:trehalose synthase